MAQETVRIMCPNLTCRKILAVPKSARGRTVRCRSCGTSIKVPAEGGGPPKAGAVQDGSADSATTT